MSEPKPPLLHNYGFFRKPSRDKNVDYGELASRINPPVGTDRYYLAKILASSGVIPTLYTIGLAFPLSWKIITSRTSHVRKALHLLVSTFAVAIIAEAHLRLVSNHSISKLLDPDLQTLTAASMHGLMTREESETYRKNVLEQLKPEDAYWSSRHQLLQAGERLADIEEMLPVPGARPPFLNKRLPEAIRAERLMQESKASSACFQVQIFSYTANCCCVFLVFVFVAYTANSVPVKSLFFWHVVCMVLTYVLVISQATLLLLGEFGIISYFKSLSKPQKVMAHFIMQLCASILYTAGFVCIYLNKNASKSFHFTTWHSKFGLATNLLMLSQLFLGTYLYLVPIGGSALLESKWWKTRPLVLKTIHRIMSITGFILAIVSLFLSLQSNFVKRVFPKSIVLMTAVAISLFGSTVSVVGSKFFYRYGRETAVLTT